MFIIGYAQRVIIDIPEATVCLLEYQRAGAFEELKNATPWSQRVMHMYGREVAQPRLTAWYGDVAYSYSGIVNEPLPFTPLLAAIRADLHELTEIDFNSVLLNYYRTGQDSIAFHSDDEPELGPEPIIASISFGAPRKFIFRHKIRRYPDVPTVLNDGSLLLMMGATQQNWFHGINKTKQDGERINLTFRQIK